MPKEKIDPFTLLNLELTTLVSGSEASEMELENNFGLMEPAMRGLGKIIVLMVRVNLFI
jgi:hypothetical protein